jgi:hypothetical protein
MCITYNDVDYHYGFYITKQTAAGPRRFDVLITKHREDQPYRYSGICLNNEYQVCTSERVKPNALIDLFDKIVGDTLASEKEYAVRYPGESFSQVIKVQEKNPDVYNDFSEKMKEATFLCKYEDMYKDLKPYLEKPPYDSGSGKNKSVQPKKRLEEIIPKVSPHIIAIIVDSKDMYLTLSFLKTNEILKGCEIKYNRV